MELTTYGTYKILPSLFIHRRLGIFEVKTKHQRTGGLNKQNVQLRPRPSCTCGKWAAYKIPCSHMLAVTAEQGVDGFEYVAPEYTLDVYLRVWETSFQSIKHEDYWPEPNGPVLIPSPARLRPPKRGRPNNSRIHNEMDVSRQRSSYHCSNCSETGHDIRKCPSAPRFVPN